jgi:sugar-phosphatase
MHYQAVIFDMDGLLIDSEPSWQAAGRETLAEYGKHLTDEQYHTSTGLRTEEWIEHWFRHFGMDMAEAPRAVDRIIELAIEKIDREAPVLPGVNYILDFFRQRGFRIGLATSSPLSLVDVVLKKLPDTAFDVIASAGTLPLGKPHPQVYLNCAAELDTPPLQCIAFEDSFYGMIAAKAARMKCVIIPAGLHYEQPRWQAADLKLGSLLEFDEACLRGL